MFWQLALLAGQAYLGIVTQRRPTKATFEEFLEANKGDETRPIPYIRGRWKTTPQRVWLGDFSARAVERDSHWSDYLIGGALAGRACWRSWTTSTAIPSAPSTRFVLAGRCTCSTPSRRSPAAASPRRKPSWT